MLLSMPLDWYDAGSARCTTILCLGGIVVGRWEEFGFEGWVGG